MNKILKYSLLSLVVIGIAGVSAVGAQTQTSGQNYPPFIQKIAEKFNLNVADVKAVFNADRGQKRQYHFENLGLTSEQAKILNDKRAELHEKYGTMKSLSIDERRLKMQKIHEEMQAFAKANGIELGEMKGICPRQGKGCGNASCGINQAK